MNDWWAWLAKLLAPYTDLISAGATAVSAVFAVVTAIIAIVAISATARDSKERTRPVVIALFRQSQNSDTAFELVIRNYGASAARDLRVTFDPPLDAESRLEKNTGMLATRYDSSVPWLPPGSELTNTWWSGVNNGGPELVNKLKTPDKVVVSVSYKGNRLRRFGENFSLAASDIALTTYNESSTSFPGRMASIAASLSGIQKTLKELRTSLGRTE
ncbi:MULTISPECIES: hypothetical protein [unclassified Microbacterium]|uniref:hypothetical protein n=1 Tax=unclassified Microbacterium TaxID=2609290 RepID=UPI00301A988B